MMRRGLLLLAACAGMALGEYQYYYTDNLTVIDPGKWTQNRVLTAGANGLTSTDQNGGSLISALAVPDGTSEYEVKTTLNLTQPGGTYVQYVRAPPDAKTGPASSGTFYSVEVQNPVFSSQTCSADLVVNQRVNGVTSQLRAAVIACHGGVTLRTVSRNEVMLGYVNDRLVWWAWDSFAAGQPGVGVFGAPAGNTITPAAFGLIDRTPPSPIDRASIKTSVFSDRIDVRAEGAWDFEGGSGIAYYHYVRGTFGHTASTPEFSDHGVAPETTYENCYILAADFHNNVSITYFSVQTPPAGHIDPRRVGIHPSDDYWGAMGEQVDMRSGNLNFSLPLVTAQGRNGRSLNLGLVYNSQNWRKDNGGLWKLGRDIGLGFGWQLMAGSITPYWKNDWRIDHFVFADASGAEHRLYDDDGDEVFTDREGIHVWYDSARHWLRFADGSYWYMGAISSGTEADAGTRYPIRLNDSNGNWFVSVL